MLLNYTLFALLFSASWKLASAKRSFKIDRKNQTFLKDGLPFRYVSGSLHYFRIPQEYWQDRLKKARAAGLNAIEVYVEWSFHEPERQHFNFDGQHDIEKFIHMADDIGLYVLLRPGPFIDAERDMGGLPYWLLSKHPEMKLRTSDPHFLKFVDDWFEIILYMSKPIRIKYTKPSLFSNIMRLLY